jgi:hypothetical protein
MSERLANAKNRQAEKIAADPKKQALREKQLGKDPIAEEVEVDIPVSSDPELRKAIGTPAYKPLETKATKIETPRLDEEATTENSKEQETKKTLMDTALKDPEIETLYETMQKKIDAKFKKREDQVNKREAIQNMIHAITQLGAAMIGKKTGVDMSNLNFVKKDFDKKLDRLSAEKQAESKSSLADLVAARKERRATKEKEEAKEIAQNKFEITEARLQGVLKASKDRLDLAERRHGIDSAEAERRLANHELNKDKYTVSVVNTISKDKIMSNSTMALNEINIALDILEAGNPVGDKAIVNFLARATGEVGALTEGDKEAFKGSSEITAKIKQLYQTYLADGKLTEENRQYLISFAKDMQDGNRRNKARRLEELADQKATQSLSRDEIMDRFTKTQKGRDVEALQDKNSPARAREWLEGKGKDDPRAAAVRKELKKLENK